MKKKDLTVIITLIVFSLFISCDGKDSSSTDADMDNAQEDTELADDATDEQQEVDEENDAQVDEGVDEEADDRIVDETEADEEAVDEAETDDEQEVSDNDVDDGLTSIYDIQYSEQPGNGTYPSPLKDEEVTVKGIVTATGYDSKDSNFFISSPQGGAWNGLLIQNSDKTPQIGDEVLITGTVKEVSGSTEINPASATILNSGNDLPQPLIVKTGDLGSADTAEKLEGVLVKVENVTKTKAPDSHYQFFVDDGSGECQIDDDLYTHSTAAVDSEYIYIIGSVDYSFGEYAVLPRSADDISVKN